MHKVVKLQALVAPVAAGTDEDQLREIEHHRRRRLITSRPAHWQVGQTGFENSEND